MTTDLEHEARHAEALEELRPSTFSVSVFQLWRARLRQNMVDVSEIGRTADGQLALAVDDYLEALEARMMKRLDAIEQAALQFSIIEGAEDDSRDARIAWLRTLVDIEMGRVR